MMEDGDVPQAQPSAQAPMEGQPSAPVPMEPEAPPQPLESRHVEEVAEDSVQDMLTPELLAAPLATRLSHKEWRVRVYAAGELASSPDKQVLPEDIALLKKMAGESQPAAQEAALIAYARFLQGNWVMQRPELREALDTPALSKQLAEKCLGGRPKQKQLAIDVFLLLVEVEEGQAVCEALLAASVHRIPKVCSGSIQTIRQILTEFGPGQFPVKDAVKCVSKWFGHRDKDVRREAMDFMVELCRWVGKDPLEPYMKELKPPQQKDLNESLNNPSILDPKAPPKTPTRLLRSKSIAINAAAQSSGTSPAAAAAAAAAATTTMFSLVDPVNVLEKVNRSFFATLESGKWTEKRDTLQSVIDVASAPLIAPGDFGPLTTALKNTLNDSNLIVRTKCIELIAALAKGLKAAFQSHARVLYPPLLLQYKEKKTTYTNAINSALYNINDFVQCYTDFLEDIKVAFSNKNATVPFEVLGYINRCVRETGNAHKAEIAKSVKPFCLMFAKGVDHQDPNVRTASGLCINAYQVLLGSAHVVPFFKDQINKGNKKIERVIKAGEEEEAKAQQQQKQEQPAMDSGPAAPVQSMQSAPMQATQPQQMTFVQQPQQPAPIQMQAAPKPQSTVTSAPIADVTDEPEPCPADQAVQIGMQTIPEDILSKLKEHMWKDRLAGMEELLNWVKSQAYQSTQAAGQISWVVVHTLANKPGFREGNFQVAGKMLEVMSALASQPSANFNRATAKFSINEFILPQTGDFKNHSQACELLSTIAEAVGFPYALSKCFCSLAEQNNPRCSIEFIPWFANALVAFGSYGLTLDLLVGQLKPYADKPIPALKRVIGKAFAALALCFGGYQAVVDSLQRCSGETPVDPQFLEHIKPVCDEKCSVPCPAPTRQSRVPIVLVAQQPAAVPQQQPQPQLQPQVQPQPQPQPQPQMQMQAQPTSVAVQQPTAPAPVDDGMMEDKTPTRVDLPSKIPRKLMNDLESPIWETRRAAVLEMDRILKEDCQMFITPTLGNMQLPLKTHLTDNNRNVARSVLAFLCDIAVAMGKPAFDRQLRVFMPVILMMLADASKANRDEVSSICLTMAANSHVHSFISCIGSVLMSVKEAVVLKKELASLLENQLSTQLPGTEETSSQIFTDTIVSLVKPVLLCAQDRQVEVRRLAQRCVEHMIRFIDISVFDRCVEEFKPAIRDSLRQALAPYHPQQIQSAPAPQSVPQAQPQPPAQPQRQAQTLEAMLRECLSEMMFSSDENKVLAAINALHELLCVDSNVATIFGNDPSQVLSVLARLAQSQSRPVRSAALSTLFTSFKHLSDVMWNFIPPQYVPSIRKEFAAASPAIAQKEAAVAASASPLPANQPCPYAMTEESLLQLAALLHQHMSQRDFAGAQVDLNNLTAVLSTSARPSAPLNVEGLFVAIAETLTFVLTQEMRTHPIVEPTIAAMSVFCDRLKLCFFNVAFLTQPCIDTFINATVRGFVSGSSSLHRAFVSAFKTLPLGSIMTSLLRIMSAVLSHNPTLPDDVNVAEGCGRAIAEAIPILDRSTYPLQQLTIAVVPEIRQVLSKWYGVPGASQDIRRWCVGLLNFLFTKDTATVQRVVADLERGSHPLLSIYLDAFVTEQASQQQQSVPVAPTTNIDDLRMRLHAIRPQQQTQPYGGGVPGSSFPQQQQQAQQQSDLAGGAQAPSSYDFLRARLANISRRNP